MKSFMGKAGDIRPGHMLSVNGKPERVFSVEELPENRVRIQYRNYTAILCRKSVPMLIHVPNARFWIWWNGDWVKITLNPDQELEFYQKWPTDEGWSSEWAKYEYDEQEMAIISESGTDGVDCDGRSSTHWKGSCGLLALSALPEETDQYGWCPARPAWEAGSRSQRDYTAEAAGY